MMTHRVRGALLGSLIIATLLLAGCGTSSTGHASGASTATGTTAATATATPLPPCAQLVPGATPFSNVSGVSGLQLPAGSYISTATTAGGGAGQYTVQSYTLCFQGSASQINGGILTPSATPTSSIGYLVHSGWTLNNLFPDPTNFAYLDYCSNDKVCLNDSGSPNPFTFVSFDQYASHSGSYTTLRLQVAAIAAPTCLNDPQYYSGTPKYTLYYDGNSVSGGNPPDYHFQMPPGTRVSTFQGGGTAGSTYVYFCSAGTQATVVSFLKLSMQNTGYTITNATASGFSASSGSNPTYSITVSVQNPNNYYLRVFMPM